MESQVLYDRGGTDLRRIIRALIRRWLLLLIFAVVAAAGGFLYSAWQGRNPIYQATAVVAVGRSRIILDLDTRIRTEQLAQESITEDSLTALAMSDEILGQVLTEVNQAFPGAGLTLGTLRPMLDVAVGKGLQRVTLNVRGQTPAVLAEVANAWAQAFVVEANRSYGVADVLTFFEDQVARAQDELDQTQQIKTALVAQDEFIPLQTEHDVLASAHEGYLNEKVRIEALLQDVGLLQAQLETQTRTQPMTATLSSENQTLLMSLVLKSQDANVESTIQAYIGGLNVEGDRSLEDGLAVLATLQGDLQAKLAYLDTRIADVLPLMSSLREGMAILSVEDHEMDTALAAVQDAYGVALRGLEEARMMAADTGNQAQVASFAVVPTSPAQPPRRLQNTLLAAALGLVVGAVTALLLEYLAADRQPVNVRTFERYCAQRAPRTLR